MSERITSIESPLLLFYPTALKGTAHCILVKKLTDRKDKICKQFEGERLSSISCTSTEIVGFAFCVVNDAIDKIDERLYSVKEWHIAGLHGEGAPWHTLLGLLCYEVIFDHSIDGVWLSSVQSEPADINSPSLYTSRQRQFDTVLEWIAGATNEELNKKIEQVWSERQGEMNSQIHFDSFEGMEQVQVDYF